MIGGGITGCSVAYHLAEAGWTDILVLEKGELTSGSTHHAAGLVTQFNPSATMMRFRRYSVELYNRLGVYNQVGSVRIASSRDGLLDLRRAVSRAAGLGLSAELLGPKEVLALLPHAGAGSLHGGVWMPTDGHIDPHIATHAIAGAARAMGVEFRTRVRVTGVRLGRHHDVTAVQTDGGSIEAAHLVNAGGI